MNIGSEVFERIDAHDRVELVIRKRELAYFRIHRCDRTLDTGLAENTSSSSTLTHRSHAVTVTPHSRARTTEVAPRPQPRSRTRLPGSSASAGRMSSSCQSGCGPISSAMTHRGSYRDDSG